MSRSLVPRLCRQCETSLRPRPRIGASTLALTSTSTPSSQRSSFHTQTSLFQELNRDARPNRTQRPSQGSSTDGFEMFEQLLSKSAKTAPRRPSSSPATSNIPANYAHLAESAQRAALSRPQSGPSVDEPFHLNIYAHKHNMHITFTKPSRDVILSYSAGNMGLRKAQRGSFDAAYQLSTYVMRKMAEAQWKSGGKKANEIPVTLNDPNVKNRGIEVVMRGYGPGREAFQKALLGTEGRLIKPLVKKVSDGTRLKFGGVRSPAVRRLG